MPLAAPGGKPAAIQRGLRLFSVYVESGGAFCMRGTTWRRFVQRFTRITIHGYLTLEAPPSCVDTCRLCPAIHPDKGHHVHVFQLLLSLKIKLEKGETVNIPPEAMGIHAEAVEREQQRLAAFKATWEQRWKFNDGLVTGQSCCLACCLDAEPEAQGVASRLWQIRCDPPAPGAKRGRVKGGRVPGRLAGQLRTWFTCC